MNSTPGQLPVAHGLYDPQLEHDACGFGFIAHIKGVKSHDIIVKALGILENLAHRGACGCDPNTGDGAGILMQIPHGFFQKALAERGIDLPEPGHYGVGMLFMPTDSNEADQYKQVIEQVAAEEGQPVLTWRDVPVDNAGIGYVARSVEPKICQVFLSRNADVTDDKTFERKLFLIRRRLQNKIRDLKLPQEGFFYVNSLSSQTVIYKGLLMPHQIPAYYQDLNDPAMETALALVHQRFSTNTFPTWTWPIRSAIWPTTARSIPCVATGTGCAPVKPS